VSACAEEPAGPEAPSTPAFAVAPSSAALGAPAFQHAPDREATLNGVLWGGGGGLFVFSAMENVRLEFTDFRTH
jgi:hypothetical protein